MDSTSDHIASAVALLTAINSGQEEVAYQMVLESDPVELFKSITGVTMVFIRKLSEMTGISPEQYLKDLGMLSYRTK